MSRPATTKVMGILNLTPDSFYAASRATLEEAIHRGLQMEQDGAEAIDVGGQSTRPGSEAVSAEEETRRTIPVIEALAKRVRIPLSIDTDKEPVARRALDAGAAMLNDITALLGDTAMPSTAARFSKVILMHMQGTPKTMQKNPRYRDVVGEIKDFLSERLAAFREAGGRLSNALIDPGIGFGKTLDHNVEILRRLEEFASLKRPLVVGASRKSFIGALLSQTPLPPLAKIGTPGTAGQAVLPPLRPEERLEGSLAVACRAAEAGAEFVRVHDVKATRRALDVFMAVRPAKTEAAVG